MNVQIGDVRPGKCFLSHGAKPQVIRVLSVRNGLVRFEARTKPHTRTWSSGGEIALPEFVTGLLREVGSDFEPTSGARLNL